MLPATGLVHVVISLRVQRPREKERHTPITERRRCRTTCSGMEWRTRTQHEGVGDEQSVGLYHSITHSAYGVVVYTVKVVSYLRYCVRSHSPNYLARYPARDNLTDVVGLILLVCT